MAKKAGKCTKYKTKRKVFIFVADEWQMYTQTNTHERICIKYLNQMKQVTKLI